MDKTSNISSISKISSISSNMNETDSTDKHTKIYDAIIVGSGAAGLNAADCLYDLGVKNIAIITEGLYTGTSINTGSDKQTYYKLSTSGKSPDSVYDMAKTYYECGGMQGYHALIESALSLRCFFKLVLAGVPFPTNEYGEYVGYRTDHDIRARASSCGPLTSKYMCQALIRRVKHKKIEIIEPKRVIELFVSDSGVRGVAAMDAGTAKVSVYAANNVIFATGGPAGIYASSVYPKSQIGGIGVPLEKGAKASSLCEWQYGLASTDFRWNLSGSYQQVIPKYVSVDGDGNVREFLADYIKEENINDLVFLKGYNWPFAPKNLTGANKSSLIDIAVYLEGTVKGNKVFMDFRENPADFNVSRLSEEAKEYLENSGADRLSSPVERLKKLNYKAYKLYLDNGIDLEKQPLAIDVCAQHCNGGLQVDENYMTNIDGLYAVGECAGVFGVTRPGGSALNSTQVSSLRASEHISSRRRHADMDGFEEQCEKYLEKVRREADFLKNNAAGEKPEKIRDRFSEEMSRYGAFVRSSDGLGYLEKTLDEMYEHVFDAAFASTEYDLYKAHINRDLLFTARAAVSSMRAFNSYMGKSRGGFLVAGSFSPENFVETVSDIELYPDNKEIIVTSYDSDGSFSNEKITVSPIPESDQWFENALTRVKDSSDIDENS